MSSGHVAEITCRSPGQTERIAGRIAPRLGAGDCLLLSGGVGAGKTHFARAVIQARLAAAGRSEDVPSPTFTLVQTYEDGQGEIWHADLYRLTNADEVIELGLEEAFDHAITLVEWPDRLGDLAPPEALWLEFSPGDDAETRHIRMWSRAPRWQPVLDALSAAA